MMFSVLLSAQTLIFEKVLQKAISQSAELRMKVLDYQIASNEIDKTKSGYYPSLSLGFNAQYNHGINGDNGFASVDNNIFNTQTQYEGSASLILGQL